MLCAVLPVEMEWPDADYFAVFHINLDGIAVLSDTAETHSFDYRFFFIRHLYYFSFIPYPPRSHLCWPQSSRFPWGDNLLSLSTESKSRVPAFRTRNRRSY